MALVVALAASAVFGGGAAAVCSTRGVNCHLRAAPDWQLEEIAARQSRGDLRLAPALRSDLVAGDFALPTDFDFLPDGRMVVATRDGVLYLVDDDGVVPTPMLDLRGRVGTWVFRGLVALAVDRSSSPAALYVAYALSPHGPGSNPSSGAPTTVRFSRFELASNVVDPRTERVILGRSSRGSCFDRPVTADCIPSDRDHIGADIVFVGDGTMFVSTGDGGGSEQNVRRAQHLDSLAGKVLHVDLSGHGVLGNPFWNGDASANRSKVWARGFRNPFRMWRTPSGELVVGDVGLDDFEELDVVERGKDYGWPCFEGSRRTPAFRGTSFCEAYYRARGARARGAWAVLPHGRWASITAGTGLREATRLPRSYRSQFVFGDWATGKLSTLPVPRSVDDPPVDADDAATVGAGLAGPVRLRVGPDGALYVLSLNVGELRRIVAKPY
jgi:glucose/arabinose dehydrogenase